VVGRFGYLLTMVAERPADLATGEHSMRKAALTVSLLTVTIGTAQAAPPSTSFLPLAEGKQWSYRLSVPRQTQVPYDVFFLSPQGMMGSSLTNGMLDWSPTDDTVTVKIVRLIGENEAVVELNELGRRLLLPPAELKEVRFVRRTGDAGVSLELHGHLAKPDGWIVGHRLVALSDTATPVAFEVRGERYAKVLESKVEHSRMAQYTPDFSVRAWVAEGLGIVQLGAFDAAGELLYRLQLE
jgi:hypothetical protein